MHCSTVVRRRRTPAVLASIAVLGASYGSIATAQAANQPPTISGAPATWVYVGSTYTFIPKAADPEGRTLVFSVANKPGWAGFDSRTGRLRGTPSGVGYWTSIQLRVSDGVTTASLPAFAIRATSRSNVAPTISGSPSTTASVGVAYSFQPTARDSNGDPLVFSISNRPSWASFDTRTGRLSGTPSSSHVTTYSSISIRASDGGQTATLPTFSITVKGASTSNTAPVISGSPAASVAVGSAYRFQPTASDPDGDAVKFGISSKPVWATFSSTTGLLSGTPTSAHVGTYSNIIVAASDGKTGKALPAFSITVTATSANRAPIITGSPMTSVAAGQSYSFKPTASDADGNALGFTVQNRPTWATFSTSTGQLSGAPTTAHVGAYPSIVISVSDGKATTSLSAFTINVTAPANAAPVISGSPATSVKAGSAYSFRPAASDANGDALTFSIANRPSWATFSTSTGQLSGAPTSAQVGSYSNIVISVCDGEATSALGAFSIAVTDLSMGGAALSWTPPTQNTDGSTLTNLAGYRVFYGASASALTQSIQVANPGLTSYLVENLSPGTYYFAVRAYTSGGLESAISNVVSKAVQ